MEAIPGSLSHASNEALRTLDAGARAVARAAFGRSGEPTTERAMAAVARTAIFADAVLAASHARLEELKGVAK